MVSHGPSADRRPWLILSRTEALALVEAALQICPQERAPKGVSEALARALRVVDLQLRWIDGSADGDEPNVTSALVRESRG
jgi:hypothetical protein